MIKIKVKPTYSKLADKEEVKSLGINIPDDWNLSQHQVDTYKAFLDPEIKVIFNTAMTGDGKSLSGYLPLNKESNSYLIATYPTNELISDQYKNFERYQIFEHLKKEQDYESVFGMKITLEMSNSIIKDRYMFINRKLENRKLIFTNPDIFHLMVSNKYGYFDWQQEIIPNTINMRFDYFLFDEFHIFDTPQIVSIVNDIAYMLSREENKKFVFLSATPKKFFKEMLEKLDIGYKEIKGSYSSNFIDGETRNILHPIKLNIDFSENILTWIKENIELIKTEILTYKNLNKKGAIIVNSIIASKEIFKMIKKILPETKLIENNGLSSDIDKSYFRNEEYDIVIGTSTIDIGIDFDINFLIFEANSQESFLQRLGRLGRVKSNNIETKIPYKAYSIIPEKVYRKLEETDFVDSNIERTFLNSKIIEVFPEKNSFKSYVNKWGSIQACSILEKGTKDESVKNLFTQKFNNLYNGNDLNETKRKFYAISKNKPEIIDNLNSFRGVNNFQCAIYDTDNKIKTYDLFFILKYAKANFIEDIDDFEDDFVKSEDDRLKIKYCKFFAKIEDYKDVSDYFYFDNIADDLQTGCLNVSSQFRIEMKNGSNSELLKINRELKKLKLVYFIPCNINSINEFRNKMNLPFNFRLFLLKNSSLIAFNQEALILDAIIKNIRFRRPENEYYII